MSYSVIDGLVFDPLCLGHVICSGFKRIVNGNQWETS